MMANSLRAAAVILFVLQTGMPPRAQTFPAKIVRIVIPQYLPSHYLFCIDVSAACWLAGFALLAWRYIPFLMSARIDGKEH